MTNIKKIDFIGIGAAKCATTWLYRCLIEHPDICGPQIKEVNYFLTKKHPLYTEEEFENRKMLFKNGLESYLNFFSHCSENSIKGEISVSYMSDPGSAKKIHETFPDVKIIAVLRDPVKRAHSFYWFARDFMLREKNKTFEDALENNPEIYINWGMYYKQLKPYFDLFPRENIGVFFVDDLKKDSVKFTQDVYKFLGADDKFIAPSAQKKENAASKVKFKWVRGLIDGAVKLLYKLKLGVLIEFLKKLGFQELVYFIHYKLNVSKIKKPELNPETGKKLRDIFREDIDKLEKLLSKDLSGWK